MRELSLYELNQVSGSYFNMGLYVDVPSLFFPEPAYYNPLLYQSFWVPYTTVTPIYNHWGYQVGCEIEEGYYETYQPVFCY